MLMCCIIPVSVVFLFISCHSTQLSNSFWVLIRFSFNLFGNWSKKIIHFSNPTINSRWSSLWICFFSTSGNFFRTHSPPMLHTLFVSFACVYHQIWFMLPFPSDFATAIRQSEQIMWEERRESEGERNRSAACYKYSFVEKWKKNSMKPLIVCKMLRCSVIAAYLLPIQNVFLDVFASMLSRRFRDYLFYRIFCLLGDTSKTI